jgi:hypothetical protein
VIRTLDEAMASLRRMFALVVLPDEPYPFSAGDGPEMLPISGKLSSRAAA